MEIKLKRVAGIHYEATSGQGHKVNIDGPPSAGGSDTGTRPMEMVLMGLAGCSGVDIVMILEKQRQKPEDIEITVTAERVDAVPAVFSKIHLNFKVSGEVSDAKLQRAGALAVEKYCSVATMLEKTAEITWSADLV